MNLIGKKLILSIALAGLSVVSLSAVAGGDAAAGKAKAALCGGCHGANGISMSPEIPNLAGQKEAYLASAIRAYKSGARKNPMMASVVPMIADGDVDNIAAYYSSLK